MSLKSKSGYYSADNRVSGGQHIEIDVQTCAHCNKAVFLNPLRERERGYCKRCDHYTCDKCAYECTPFQQTIDILLKHPNEPVMILDHHGMPIVRAELREKERLF
jgi:uncharacterized paraquat-inducible protein A